MPVLPVSPTQAFADGIEAQMYSLAQYEEV